MRVLLVVLICVTWCYAAGVPANAKGGLLRDNVTPCLKQKFPLRDPGFTGLYYNKSATSPQDRYTLLVSTFGAIPFSRDSVFIARHVGRYVNDPAGNLPWETVSSNLIWPNEVSAVPEAVFGANFSVIAVPDGFLVPTKGRGSIKVFDLSNPLNGYDLTTQPDDETTWFYHRATWTDMDKDGDLDLLTARAHVSLTGSHKGQLVWFSREKNGSPWKPHMLSTHADVNFIQLNLTAGNDTFPGILCAEFFSKKLTLLWSEDPKGDWSNTSAIKTRVLTSSLGPMFDLTSYDLNADGVLDILVTSNSQNGSLYAFTPPMDFRTDTWAPITLASGFKPDSSFTGKGSPGTAIPVFPGPGYISKKPLIVLSGDDDGRAYVMEAASDNPADWRYTTRAFYSPGGTVGGMTAADVDGDGYTDLLVPDYSGALLVIFSFNCK